MDSMEYRLSKFKNDIANQFGHNVFYKKVLIRVFYYLLEKRINTRILFLMTTYRRLLNSGSDAELSPGQLKSPDKTSRSPALATTTSRKGINSS